MKLPKNTALTKVLTLIAVFIVLCVALAQIGSLVTERGNSQQQAAAELADTYAGPQKLVGPMLVVPYIERWTEEKRVPAPKPDVTFADEKEKKDILVRVPRTKKMAHIVFPQKMDLNASLTPQERYRGLFKVLFYHLKGNVTGTLAPFDPATIPRSEKDSTLELLPPVVAVSLTDMRGIDDSPVLKALGSDMPFLPGIPGGREGTWMSSGIHAPLTGAALQAFEKRQPIDFSLNLSFAGQEKLAIAPIADQTTAQLTSPWPHPSFGGRFLAEQRNVTKDGFKAQWRISSLASSARAQLVASSSGRSNEPSDSFDVSLAQTLNVYSLSNRAVKYGALFVGLTLMAAFMFELLRKLRMHPIQYALVGLSIALFFLLLLALSEKMAFWQAYACAASASVLLLGVYFSAILQGWRRGVSLAAYVAVLYAALYGLLLSESNALLLGAMLLFGMLALLMIATRRVDWYSLGGGKDDAPVAVPA